MKLIASGVTFSAASVRSPSFSRSSSSTTITKRPRAISRIASSIAAKRAPSLPSPPFPLPPLLIAILPSRQILDHISSHHVHFEVDRRARRAVAQVRDAERLRDQRHIEAPLVPRGH